MRRPAAMLTTSCPASLPANGATASFICCGLTASTMTSQFEGRGIDGRRAAHAEAPGELVARLRATVRRPDDGRREKPLPAQSADEGDRHVAAADEGDFHVVVFPFAEDCRADAHDGRPFHYGRLEVVRHAHRQRIEPRAFGTEAIEQIVQQGKAAALQAHVVAGLRNRHQTPQPQSRQDRDGARQVGQPRRDCSRSWRPRRNIYLKANLQRAGPPGAARQAARRFSGVPPSAPRQSFRPPAGSCCLQRADEVPFKAGIPQFGGLATASCT
jgi:hypothetical protein